MNIPVENALRQAEMEVDEIDHIVLVGGSTRLPWVHQWVSNYFGKAPYVDLNPDEGVAYGATIMAGVLSGSQNATKRIVLQDLIPLSLGVRLAGNTMGFIIP